MLVFGIKFFTIKQKIIKNIKNFIIYVLSPRKQYKPLINVFNSIEDTIIFKPIADNEQSWRSAPSSRRYLPQ